MTQHPDEGALHAYLDGELPAAEADALELHVRACASCAAALAEARGHVAAASRVIVALDGAPSSAASAGTPAVAAPAVRQRGGARPLLFRAPFARAAALLLLVGGTVVVADRTGTLVREKSVADESVTTEAATVGDAATGQSVGAGRDATGDAARSDQSPPFVGAGVGADGARRARQAERRAPAPVPAPATVAPQGADRRSVTEKTIPPAAPAADLAAAPAAAPLPAPPPPPRAREPMTLSEVVVTGSEVVITGAAEGAASETRYRTRQGIILTLTDEPLKTTVAEESAAARQSVAPRAQQSAAAAMAAPVINSYRWSSAERGRTYTLSGALTVAELEEWSKRLSELERLP